MTEKLLHFIWQFQYFNKTILQTEEGEELIILNQGTLNTNQGPDFLNATIQLNAIILVGNIELHVNTSDWTKHKHNNDENYNNVILHVVWNNDKQIITNQSSISTLELKNIVAKILLDRYQNLMQANKGIACKKFLPVLNSLQWLAFKESLVAERLEEKSKKIVQLLTQNKQHWEEVFWWLLAANFGNKINKDCFQEIAQTIQVNVLAKHKNQLQQLEALLFGQANLLNSAIEDDYYILLQKEYKFLQHKYQLKKVNYSVLFHRLRPANFPTIRLAQLAKLISNSSHLFSKILVIDKLTELKFLFQVTANDYWHYHFNFSEKSAYQPKSLGNQMIENIIINTVVPMLFAYGLYNKEEHYKTKAIEWLQALSPEKNSVITEWKNTEITAQTAFDTQALLQLNKFYCTKLNCLSCAVGVKILRASN